MAVYTHLSGNELRGHLERFNVGDLVEAKGVSGGTVNTIYDVSTTEGRYILRILEERTVTDARFEESLIMHLAERGLVVPRMMEAEGGVGHILSINANQQLSLFEYLPGRELAVFELTDHHAEQIGEFLGAMHVAAVGLRRRRRNRFSPQRVDLLLKRCQAAMEGDPRASDLDWLARQLALCQWPRHLTRGVIHGDLFVDNARFHKGILCGVLDFEMASNGPLAYDIAVAMMDWCFSSGEFDAGRGRALVSGYLKRRELDNGERAQLFSLCVYAACRFTITRFYDFEVRTRPEAQRKYKDYRHFLGRMKSLMALSADRFNEVVFQPE